MRKKEWEQQEARRLRGLGYTIPEIALELGVSKGSVSAWVRGVPLTEEQLAQIDADKRAKLAAQNKGGQANREKFLKLREQYQADGRARAREMRPLHMMGCMLFWAEGTKTRNNLTFVNSDPAMILFWMRFLREEMGVEDEVIRVRAHVHHEDQVKPAERYWLQLTGLPKSALRKTQIKKGSDTRHNTLKHGVCSVRVQSTELVMHVFGAIQEYGGFENPDWLF